MGDCLLLDMSGNDLSSVIEKDYDVLVNDAAGNYLKKYLFPLGVQCVMLEENVMSAQMLQLF